MKYLALIFLSFVHFCLACKKEKKCVEKLQQDCFCYEIYRPVCGCNGKTYDNDCFAKCDGITDFKEGKCP